MRNSKLQQLADARAMVEKLEKSIAAERESILRSLHESVGLASREELIDALRALKGGAKRGRKPGRPATAAAAKGKGKGGRKKRAKITPEIRDGIIAAVKSGATGGAIAAKFGVSLPTVQNIKNAAGLTKKRKGK